ncbi:MAG: GFA family protein [Vitreimonas sp.]
MPIEGGCHCGAVRYALAAAPEASMICHCRTCRAISGAPVLAWISTTTDKFAITKGAPQLYASSASVQRQFCGRCGTQLTYVGPDYGAGIDIATASLDDPGAFAPTHHSWLSHDIAWIFRRRAADVPEIARRWLA